MQNTRITYNLLGGRRKPQPEELEVPQQKKAKTNSLTKKFKRTRK
jgi:hypothetical protein